VRALRKAELSPSQSGILIHRVLERIVSKYGGAALKDLPEEMLRAEIAAEIDVYLHEVVAESETIPKRVIAGFSRIGDELYELLRRLGEEFSRSLFEPVAFELPIREGGRVEPLHLYTADGCEVLVEGTVDRVDTAVVNGKRYVRVVDYKSGGKTFRLRDVYYGLNLQMLIYLFSIWQNGTGTLGGALPAGVLYLPALGKYQSGDRAGEDDDKLLQKQYRMNGLLLRDPAVLEAMETDGQAIFIPVKPDTEKSDALASLAQMGRLRSLVERRMTDMAEALRAGTIPALPAEIDNEPCRNCDYRGVCGFEAGDPMRELSQLPREVILGEEESDDAVCPDA
jgi:ATP-dependent helicase/nuclease subunit B